MPVKLPDTTKHPRIVHQFSGPYQHLQLRHVPSTRVIHSEGGGPDLAAGVEAMRRRAIRHGYAVDEGFAVGDWREIAG